MSTRLRPLLLALTLLAPGLRAHDAPGSSGYDLLVPNMPLGGAITFVSLVGPASGETVLHATWNLTYTAPAGGTPAADVILELSLPIVGGSLEWAVTGADFGWPVATGTFTGTLGSDQLNGVLGGGPFGFTVPELVILSTSGGVTGKFVNSTITLELADVCQPELGFAGPGDAHLQVCGEPLATGGAALLSLEGAPPFAPVFLVAGLTLAPTPFKGGTLVPVPFLVAVPLAAGAPGTLTLPVPGGAGPLTVYVQAVVLDASQPQGVALSNAVQVELLP